MVDYNSSTAAFIGKNKQDYLVSKVSVEPVLLWNGEEEEQPFRNIFDTVIQGRHKIAMTDQYVALESSRSMRKEIWIVRISDRSCRLLWEQDSSSFTNTYFLGMFKIKREHSEYVTADTLTTGMFLDGDSLFLIRNNCIDRIHGNSKMLLDCINGKARYSDVSCQDHVIYYADEECVLRAYDYREMVYRDIPYISAVNFYVHKNWIVYQDMSTKGALVAVNLTDGAQIEIAQNAEGSCAVGSRGVCYRKKQEEGLFYYAWSSEKTIRILEEDSYFFDIVSGETEDLLVYQTLSEECVTMRLPVQ